MRIHSTSDRQTKIATEENFTGQVFLDGLAMADPPSRLNATLVTFSLGARTAWHRHGFRQVLLATVGSGFVQVKGEPARELHPGDVAIVPPDTVHWHGAARDSLFTHLALLESEGEGTTWLQHVSDKDYDAAIENRRILFEAVGT